MTLYLFVLFIHVVSAMGLFIGLALEGFVFLRIRVAQDTEQLQVFIRAFNFLRWIFIPSFGGILLGGLYLASKYGGGTFWIPSALSATLAIMLVGGLITGREMNQLKKTLAKTDATFQALSAQANDGLLMLSYGLRSGVALGIVFLMTAKTSLWPSVFALVAGCSVGLLIASGIGKVSGRTGMCCGPSRHRSLQNAPAASAH
jgi:hypothetical protein